MPQGVGVQVPLRALPTDGALFSDLFTFTLRVIDMIKRLLPILAAALFAGTVSAQPAATPAASAKTNLSSAEKKFIKDAAEAHLSIMRLTEVTRNAGPGSVETKALTTKLNDDLTKSWGELAPLADAAKVTLPKSEPSAGDKAGMEKLKKLDVDKFDKQFLKALSKETGKGFKTFDTAVKSVQNPELKTFVSTHALTMKAHADAVSAAEDAASKKK